MLYLFEKQTKFFKEDYIMSNETSQINDIKQEPDIKQIKLSEIDYDSVIKPIREVRTNSRDYEKLKNAIKKDGQLHPITVRHLTDEEKEKTGAQYGIIDGHNRYKIAEEKKDETILAKIYKTTKEDKNLTYKDIMMAYRLNESTIRMSSLEKGKVIYDLLELQEEGKGKKATGDDVAKIGEEVFGLKKTMTYAALRKYKRESGIETIDKTREYSVDFNDLTKSLSGMPKNKETLDKLQDKKAIEDSLDAIQKAQKQLKLLQKSLQSRITSNQKNE